MKKWQTIKNIYIETIGYGGVGVATSEDGRKILIKWSVLPNSTIDGRIFKIKKDYIIVMPVRIISVDVQRTGATAKCSHYNNPLQEVSFEQEHKIGYSGCKREIVPYDKQLELKTMMVKDCFRHTPDLIWESPLLPIIWSPLDYQYRNKIEFSFWKYIRKSLNDRKNWKELSWEEQKNGFSHYHERQLGYHLQWSFNHIIDVDRCYLISDRLHLIYDRIKKLTYESWIPVYDQKTHKWIFRSLLMREGFHTEEIMVCLTVSSEQIDILTYREERNSLIEIFKTDSILQTYVTTFLVLENNTVSDAIRWTEVKSTILRGAGVIFEELHFGGKVSRFRISPSSFFQTNTYGAEILFQTAAQYVKLPDNKMTILDLYCGAGTIGLSFLKHNIWTNLIGIEIVEAAIYDAKFNAKMNHLSEKSYFVAGKTEELFMMDSIIQSKLDDIWLILVDPPREWLHKDVCLFLNDLKKKYNFQLIYISCNPTTLVRDLEILKEGWRNIDKLQPVDMFPHTHHVEMISVLS